MICYFWKLIRITVCPRVRVRIGDQHILILNWYHTSFTSIIVMKVPRWFEFLAVV